MKTYRELPQPQGGARSLEAHMARTSTRRWKGCQLCKPHKNASNGDTIRTPWKVLRKVGKSRRYRRNAVYDES